MPNILTVMFVLHLVMKRIEGRPEGSCVDDPGLGKIPDADSLIRTLRQDAESAPQVRKDELWTYVDVVLPAVADGWAKGSTRQRTSKCMDDFVTCSDEAIALWMLKVYKEEWERALLDVAEKCLDMPQKVRGRKGKRPSIERIDEFSDFGKTVKGLRTSNRQRWLEWMAWIKEQYRAEETVDGWDEYDGMEEGDQEEDPFTDFEAV